ncbi:DUF2442 domain-containing protein [Bradyrhizobium pachyrhizi]|uniref:DUF2442 domain-containing protein n=1 Tax=Bradyrhizobium pachyrhizi TaxID=280333 RepID=A0A844T267_9BRAD|nr:DUF2442 domain-containing protein [Bradyrhizobium pachyrhizi]MVT68750.1 DUF2442 domain-containing protein [Bradyrhizobium pachyrhizi]
MSENEIIDSGVPLPRLASVQSGSPYTLLVRWADGPRAGKEDYVDVKPIIFSYKVYKPLREENLFLTSHIAEDGDAVAWDGNDDLMMSADTIHALAEQIMKPKDFVAFLARTNLTQEAAAAQLGRSRRQIATYATTGPIPRIVAWACFGFEEYRRARTMAQTLENSEKPDSNRAA